MQNVYRCEHRCTKRRACKHVCGHVRGRPQGAVNGRASYRFSLVLIGALTAAGHVCGNGAYLHISVGLSQILKAPHVYEVTWPALLRGQHYFVVSTTSWPAPLRGRHHFVASSTSWPAPLRGQHHFVASTTSWPIRLRGQHHFVANKTSWPIRLRGQHYFVTPHTQILKAPDVHEVSFIVPYCCRIRAIPLPGSLADTVMAYTVMAFRALWRI